MAAPNIAFIRPELEAVLPNYTIIYDCINQRVKEEGSIYLPRPNPEDTSYENSLRYDSYRTRAVFYHVTGRTLNGLVGQIYANDPVIELPSQLKAMEKDCNGNGISLVQNSKQATRWVASVGRGGLYTDYPIIPIGPNGERVTTKAQLDSGEIKPSITVYAPENIINWQKIRKGGKHIYSLIVLATKKQVAIDEYKYSEQVVYKALRLKLNQATGKHEYYIEIWEPVITNGVTESAINPPPVVGGSSPSPGFNYPEFPTEILYPKDANGNFLEEIPFDFIGAEDNDSDIDAAPLLPLAELNIGHYRNSADYEEACFQVGQPTYVIAGLTELWFKDVLQGKLQIGSRGGIPLPVGATAEIMQVAPNSMAKEAMEHKELQMAAIGAKLVEQKAVAQTATQASINDAAQNSALSDIAKNVSAAFTAALNRALLFTGGTGTVEFTLNTDFAINRMSAQDQAQLISEWVQQAITFSEMRRGLRESGIAFEDDKAAQTAIDADTAKKADQAAEAAKKLSDAVPQQKPAFGAA